MKRATPCYIIRIEKALPLTKMVSVGAFCSCGILGNTAQRLCVRCVVRFFGRLPRNSAGILPYGKGFLSNMTENLHADCVQSRQAGFVRCCPKGKYRQCGTGSFLTCCRYFCRMKCHRRNIKQQQLISLVVFYSQEVVDFSTEIVLYYRVRFHKNEMHVFSAKAFYGNTL